MKVKATVERQLREIRGRRYYGIDPINLQIHHAMIHTLLWVLKENRVPPVREIEPIVNYFKKEREEDKRRIKELEDEIIKLKSYIEE